MKKKLGYLSFFYIYQYIKLAFRITLFTVPFILYIINRVRDTSLPFGESGTYPIFWMISWIMLIVGMIIRFFPSKLEPIGCQKHLKCNYVPTDEEKPKLTSSKATLIFAALWIGVNLIFGILYLTDVIDAGMLILLTFAYGICDIVCILFFCPIRDLFLKNKCCTDCRIYNWDYAMMFTPFLFIPHFYTWSLLALSLVLLAIWEITLKLHPERFAKNTNASLACENCKERPCRHKKRIAKIINKGKDKLTSLSWWKQK